MLFKLRKFFPKISISEILFIVLVSICYGLSTILTIYLLSNISPIINNAESYHLPTFLNFFINNFIKIFNLTTLSAYIVMSITAIIAMSICGTLKIYLTHKIAALARNDLSIKLLNKTIDTNSPFTDNTHSGKIKNLVLDESMHVVLQSLKPVIEIFSSIIFIIILVINLFFFNSFLTVVFTFIFSIFYLLNYFIFKNVIKKYGELRYLSNKDRFEKIDDALNSRIISNVLNTKNLFEDRYKKSSSQMAQNQYMFEFISQTPKIIMESVIFFSIIIAFYLLTKDIIQNNSDNAFIETLIIFAFTGVKILPEFQRIFLNFGFIKFGEKSQKYVMTILNYKKLPFIYNKVSNALIHFRCDFSLKGEKKILKKINFKINKNDIIAISGASGSGKTTFISSLMGISPINLNNKFGYFKTNYKIGYLPQESQLFSGSIIENIIMGRKKSNNDLVNIEKNVKDLFRELKNKKEVKLFLKRKIKNVDNPLSIGQKQRLGLLRSLYDNPDILVLDEFTSALDKKNEEIILKYINQIKFLKSIIIVGHKKNTFKNCNRFLYLNDGNLYEK